MNKTAVAAGVGGAGGALATIVWLWNWLAVARHGAPEMPVDVAGFIAMVVGAAFAVLGHALEEVLKDLRGSTTVRVSTAAPVTGVPVNG